MKQHNRLCREQSGNHESVQREKTLDQWKQHKQEIGGITYRTVESPAQIASRHGVLLEGLGDALKREVAECAEDLKTASSVDAKHLRLIADLHDLWRARKEGNPELNGRPWGDTLQSFDSFIGEFAPDVTLHARGWIGKHIEWFVREYTGSSGQLTIYPPRKNLEGGRDFTEEEIKTPAEIAPPERDWVYMPCGAWNRIETYIARPVLEEIVFLLESGYRPPDYSHASGSAALKGIAEEGAIVNSLELLEMGKGLKTGEKSHYMSTDAVELRGLGSIYTDKGDPRPGYNTLRWFDEYHVTFGINKERQSAYMRTTDVRYEDSRDPEQLSYDTIMNEGTLVGRRVPLDAIDYVYAWHGRKEDAEKWTKAHCPHAQVVALEAIHAIHEFGRDIGRIAQEEGVEPLDIWKRIAKEG